MPGAGRDPRAIQMSAAMNDYSSRSPKPDKDTLRKESQAKRLRPLVLERYSKLKALRSDLLLRLFKTPRGSGLWRWLRHCLKYLEKSFETLSTYESSKGLTLKSGGGAGEKSQSARGPPESMKSSFLSLTRRGFIGGALAGAVSIITPGFIKNAFAGSSLPPGIAMSTQAIKTSWYALKSKDFAAVESYMGLSAKKYQDYSFDRNNEPKNEPATYLILAMINRSQGAYGNLPESDPMMLWGKGIGNYTSRWINKKDATKEQMQEFIETPFLSAIFKCAGRDASDVEGYFLMSDTQKQQFLGGLIDGLKDPSDKTKVTLSNGEEVYRVQLIAAWSSFFLTTHYDFSLGKGVFEGDNMYKLEQATKKMIGGPIRGQPYYGITNKV